MTSEQEAVWRQAPVWIDYINHKGVRRIRKIQVVTMIFAHTEWHRTPQWLLRAIDLEKNEPRSFAMKDILGWYTDEALANKREPRYPMETAPKNNTLVKLWVVDDVDARTSLEDTEEGPTFTIGFNQFEDTGEDVWQFVGWDWEQDCFIDGAGTPVAWAPLR